MGVTMLAMLSRLPERGDSRLLRTILARFFEGDDRSRFGLMNAVTSVARDTPDPDLRWRLEEFGGGIPAVRTFEPVLVDAGAALLPPNEDLLIEAFAERTRVGVLVAR